MQLFLMISLLVVAILLIGIILIQQGKGAEMGASFGAGGSNTLFGAPGAGNFLTKSTTVLAIAFFAIAIAISTIKKQDATTDGLPASEAEVSTETGAQAAEIPGSDIPSLDIPTPTVEEISTEIPSTTPEAVTTEIPTAEQAIDAAKTEADKALDDAKQAADAKVNELEAAAEEKIEELKKDADK